jgi:hypothetical protein
MDRRERKFLHRRQLPRRSTVTYLWLSPPAGATRSQACASYCGGPRYARLWAGPSSKSAWARRGLSKQDRGWGNGR